MSLSIRPATRHDLPALLALYQHLSAGDDTPPPALAENILDRFHAYPDSAVLVGETEGVVAVSCTLVVIPNLTRGGQPYALVENVVTHSEHLRKGFGRRILHDAAERAWRAGCYKVMLMTGSTKPETLDFYVRTGFEQSKTGFQMRRVPPRPET